MYCVKTLPINTNIDSKTNEWTKIIIHLSCITHKEKIIKVYDVIHKSSFCFTKFYSWDSKICFIVYNFLLIFIITIKGN